MKAIPISAIIGIAVGLGIGFFVYWANRQLKNKFYVALFITLLLVFLSTGLFTGGCHEFEEVWGETRKVWKIENPNMSHKKLPMAIFKPFGYSSSRTVLQICCFWLFLALSTALHVWKIHATKKINEEIAQGKLEQSSGNESSEDDVEKGELEDNVEVGEQEETA